MKQSLPPTSKPHGHSELRAVIDTNVLVNAFIKRQSTSGRVLEHVRKGGLTPIYSAAMLDELLNVLGRPHFQRRYFIRSEDIDALFALLQAAGKPVVVQIQMTDCRDPKDNKFLEAALAGRAACIISGDEDLQVLHPWRSIEILAPAQVVARLAG